MGVPSPVFIPSLHPRDRLGRWMNTYNPGPARKSRPLALVERLIDNSPEGLKSLWDDDPRDSIAQVLDLNNAPTLTTIEQAKARVYEVTQTYLRRKYPSGRVKLYRGGVGFREEMQGTTSWTPQLRTARFFAGGDDSAIRERETKIEEIVAALPAFRRHYDEEEYLLPQGAEGKDSPGAPAPLPMRNGLYYRLHKVGTPFGPEHASTVAPIPEDVLRHTDSEALRRMAVPQEGYSAFWNPHHLAQYVEEMNWEPKGVRVVAFEGTPVGEGHDGEPRVMPTSTKAVARMGWQQFLDRLDWTPNGYGRWHEHTWGDGPDGTIADDGYRTLAQIGKDSPGAPGRSVGDALAFPKTGELKVLGERVVKAVDSLLELPELDRIPVMRTSGKGARGAFSRQFLDADGNQVGSKKEDGGVTVLPKGIRVSLAEPGKTAYPHSSGMTIAHELAHYLDYEGFQRYRTAPGRKETTQATISLSDLGSIDWASQGEHVRAAYVPNTDTPLAEWLLAVRETDAFNQLRVEIPFMHMETHKYLVSAVELFARSFAQWVALRSGDPELLAELRKWQTMPPVYVGEQETWRSFERRMIPVEMKTPRHLLFRQWQDADFEPVADALDRAFERMGWLRDRGGAKLTP